ncbi:transporter substrate-binding domain-containing protein [Frankia sp. Cj3]|uniref:transporter substrate-binding domain-containing protein n=1 Tax=Frankia sp. Cj3 TaxID=2880976 RepID=UPI001EF6C1EA|nr:transporter substrate-binding domain-containing protein [Frankia sp. Cj3]
MIRIAAPFRLVIAGTCILAAVACGVSQPDSATPPTPSPESGDLTHKDTLRVGVRIDNPGLGEIVNGDPNNRQGFEIDVVKYIASRLGAKHIEWHDVFPAERAKVLESGEVDIVVAAFAISANRMDQVSFAGPYIMSGQDILIRSSDADSITGLASLNTKKVCVTLNSTSAERLVQEFGKKWNTTDHIISLPTIRECIAKLLDGGVDAVSSGNMILVGYAAANPARLLMVGHPFTVDNVGIGLASSNSRSIPAINAALKQMVDDGTWAKSIREHFGQAAGLFLANPPVPGRLSPSWSIPDSPHG